MRKLSPFLLALLLFAAAAPASARGCTGKCWPATGDCYACGFSAFFGSICLSGSDAGICYCEEYACPTASFSAGDQDRLAGGPGGSAIGVHPKVLQVRVLAPRV